MGVGHRAGRPHQLVGVLLLVIDCCITSSWSLPDTYHSLIRAIGNNKALHFVGDGECVDAALLGIGNNSSMLIWNKEPLGWENEIDLDGQLVWSGVHSAIYTLKTSPSVIAINVNSGKPRWSWPPHSLWPLDLLFRRWTAAGLPRSAQLNALTPADDLLLLHSQRPASHVFALDPHAGVQTWEFVADKGYEVRLAC